jgi:hypothetical protein
MAGSTGPDIVTDGLVLSLDAANKKCFTPGNTICNNIITGGSVTGANGSPSSGAHTPSPSNFPSYNSTNGGVFDFVGGKGMNFEEDLGFTTTRTLIMWFYKNTGDVQYFSDARNDGGRWFFANYQNHNITYTHLLRYNFGGSYNASHPDFINKWHCMVVTSDNTESRLYLAGTEVDSYVSQTSIDEDFGKNFRIGTRYTTSHQWTGYFGPILAYNRVLTDSEILNYYNQTKSRFI